MLSLACLFAPVRPVGRFGEIKCCEGSDGLADESQKGVGARDRSRGSGGKKSNYLPFTRPLNERTAAGINLPGFDMWVRQLFLFKLPDGTGSEVLKPENTEE